MSLMTCCLTMCNVLCTIHLIYKHSGFAVLILYQDICIIYIYLRYTKTKGTSLDIVESLPLLLNECSCTDSIVKTYRMKLKPYRFGNLPMTIITPLRYIRTPIYPSLRVVSFLLCAPNNPL